MGGDGPRTWLPQLANAHFWFTCERLAQVEEVTVFGHFLHMHENGQRMVTRQYRNDSSGNEVLVRTAEVEYYSFLQAGGHVVDTDSSATIQVG